MSFESWLDGMTEHVAKKLREKSKAECKTDVYTFSLKNPLDALMWKDIHSRIDPQATGKFKVGDYVYFTNTMRPLAKVLGYRYDVSTDQFYVLVWWSDDVRRMTMKGTKRAHGGYDENDFVKVEDDKQIIHMDDI